MHPQQFVKLMKDCDVLNRNSNLEERNILVICSSETFKDKQRQKLTYSCFLACLMIISNKLETDDFKTFLQTDILTRAKTMLPIDIEEYKSDNNIQQLMNEFKWPLKEIFEFYSTHIDRRNVSHVISYHNFCQFTKNFGISGGSILSTYDIGKIFIASVAIDYDFTKFPALNFEQFINALLRCSSLLPSPDRSLKSDKLKGILYLMWKSSQVNGSTSYKVNHTTLLKAYFIIQGSHAFKSKFTIMWQKDGYDHYLAGAIPEMQPQNIFDIVSNLEI